MNPEREKSAIERMKECADCYMNQTLAAFLERRFEEKETQTEEEMSKYDQIIHELGKALLNKQDLFAATEIEFFAFRSELLKSVMESTFDTVEKLQESPLRNVMNQFGESFQTLAITLKRAELLLKIHNNRVYMFPKVSGSSTSSGKNSESTSTRLGSSEERSTSEVAVNKPLTQSSSSEATLLQNRPIQPSEALKKKKTTGLQEAKNIQKPGTSKSDKPPQKNQKRNNKKNSDPAPTTSSEVTISKEIDFFTGAISILEEAVLKMGLMIKQCEASPHIDLMERAKQTIVDNVTSFKKKTPSGEPNYSGNTPGDDPEPADSDGNTSIEQYFFIRTIEKLKEVTVFMQRYIHDSKKGADLVKLEKAKTLVEQNLKFFQNTADLVSFEIKVSQLFNDLFRAFKCMDAREYIDFEEAEDGPFLKSLLSKMMNTLNKSNVSLESDKPVIPELKFAECKSITVSQLWTDAIRELQRRIEEIIEEKKLKGNNLNCLKEVLDDLKVADERLVKE